MGHCLTDAVVRKLQKYVELLTTLKERTSEVEIVTLSTQECGEETQSFSNQDLSIASTYNP